MRQTKIVERGVFSPKDIDTLYECKYHEDIIENEPCENEPCENEPCENEPCENRLLKRVYNFLYKHFSYLVESMYSNKQQYDYTPYMSHRSRL